MSSALERRAPSMRTQMVVEFIVFKTIADLFRADTGVEAPEAAAG